MDYLLKALALSERVRVYVTRTTEMTNDAIAKHDLWPSAASVLGKTMTIGAMMGAMLKGEEALTIKIDGNGPVGVVTVDANAKCEVRGYVESPHVHFSKQNKIDDVYTLGYNGYIDVIKDLKLKDLFTSSIPLETGDLAKDFTYYFTCSEQVPSAISLGSSFDVDNRCTVCGGIIIQLLPNALEEDIEFIEKRLDLLSNMSTLLTQYENLEEIIKLVFEEDYVILEKVNVKFHCPCTKNNITGIIMTLGQEQLQEILDTDKKAEVICHYCNTHYTYDEDDLKELIHLIERKNKQ